MNPLTLERVLPAVMCDWTTGVHRYLQPVKPLESGKLLKLDRDGTIEWEKNDWQTLKCPSSDTSLRISCDGERLRFSGNIGRFQQHDNLNGVGVVDCMDRWAQVLATLGIDLYLFGSVHNQGTAFEAGTTLSRVDLAQNIAVDDYGSFCNLAMMRRLGRRLPLMGRYGPTWGYTSKRANWWKAKLYDKSAELAGERGPRSGATIARFEVQLGSEFLKREGLIYVNAWNARGKDMAEIIYGRFSSELMQESASVTDWGDIPARIRHFAVLWRDGQDVRTMMSKAQFYKNRARLLEFGIDIGVPCNVVSLTRRVREVSVTPLNSRREFAA